MTVSEMNQLAAPIFDLLAETFSSCPRGVGILPERLSFSLSVSPDDEPQFLSVIQKLLVTNDSFGDDAPVVLLVSRWVGLSFEGDSLDQTGWQIMFDLNPRVSPNDDSILVQLNALLNALSHD